MITGAASFTWWTWQALSERREQALRATDSKRESTSISVNMSWVNECPVSVVIRLYDSSEGQGWHTGSWLFTYHSYFRRTWLTNDLIFILHKKIIFLTARVLARFGSPPVVTRSKDQICLSGQHHAPHATNIIVCLPPVVLFYFIVLFWYWIS